MSWIECPECGQDCEGGSFGDNATCHNCKKTWETDWEYLDAYEGNITAWITKEIEYEKKENV